MKSFYPYVVVTIVFYILVCFSCKSLTMENLTVFDRSIVAGIWATIIILTWAVKALIKSHD